jgi:hypothetical protein
MSKRRGGSRSRRFKRDQKYTMVGIDLARADSTDYTARVFGRIVESHLDPDGVRVVDRFEIDSVTLVPRLDAGGSEP